MTQDVSSTQTKANEILKSYREQKRISLQSVHQTTKISLSYLQALESGQWDLFPAEIYLLGFMRKYASCLGLDPEEIVTLYKKEVDPIKTEQENLKNDSAKKSDSHLFFNGILLFFIFALLGGWWLYTIMSSTRSSKKDPVNIAELKNRMSRFSFVQTEPLSLEVRSIDTVWIRIVADKKLLYEGFLSSSHSRSYPAKEEIVIRVGNVDSVRLSLNGLSIDPYAGAKNGINEITLTHRSLYEGSISMPDQ